MVISSLNKKLLRDLRGFKAQIISISAVMAIGVGVLFGFNTTYDSLKHARDTFYKTANFAELFVGLKKAPLYIADQVQRIDNIIDIETRLVYDALINIPGFDEPAVALLISIPDGQQPRINKLFVKFGRLPLAKAPHEIVVNESFFKAQKFKLGDSLQVTLNGRRKDFTIVGVGVTPEHLVAIQPGSPFPDDLHFANIWMSREALANAYDMKSAFNNLVLKFSSIANENRVKYQIDQLLEPYGAGMTLGRDQQVSHVYVSEELKQLQVQAKSIPIIFFLVAAYILNVVISRLVSAQRSEIATLKAVGYFSRQIGAYYFQVAGTIILIGTVLGIGLGIWIGQNMTQLYSGFYRIPLLSYDFSYDQVLLAVIISFGTTLLGVYSSLKNIFKLSPAEAMRPPSPMSFHKNPFEGSAWLQSLKMQTRMTFRGLWTSPKRSILTTLGMSMTIVLLVSGLFWNDVMDHLMYTQYGLVQRETASIHLVKPLSPTAVYEIQKLPGVLEAEGYLSVGVKVKRQNIEQLTAIKGLPEKRNLYNLIDDQQLSIHIPEGGIFISRILANQLHVQVGDEIEIEAIEGKKPKMMLRVEKILDTYMSNEILTSRKLLSKWLRQGDRVNSILFRSAKGTRQLYTKLKEMPQVLSVTYKDSALQMFNDTSAKYILIFAFILSIFAGAIGFGIVYNNVQVTLAERDWEIATMRILGFRTNEVFWVLVAEISVLLLLCLPFGWVLGYLNARWLLDQMTMEVFQLPFVFDPRTFFTATLVLLGAATLGGLVMYRKVKKMDFVAALKSRG